VATLAASLGATVVLHGRTQKKLEAVYDSIVEQGHVEPAIMPLDLAKATESELEAVAIGVRKDFGRLDGLIHCAAFFTRLTPLEHATLVDSDMHFRVNVTAPLALTRACLPLLRQTGRAQVIFTGETHGLAPKPFWGAFALAKSALATGADMLAAELVHSDPSVCINVLVPGPIDSPQRRQSHPADDFAKLRKPAQIASAYVWLLLGRTEKQVSAHYQIEL
jgi:short-subunit dehydrogenase